MKVQHMKEVLVIYQQWIHKQQWKQRLILMNCSANCCEAATNDRSKKKEATVSDEEFDVMINDSQHVNKRLRFSAENPMIIQVKYLYSMSMNEIIYDANSHKIHLR